MSSLSHQTIRNSIYGFIGFIWPLLLAFAATPLLIKGLGTEKYGYYVLLNVSTALFMLLDFGLSYTFTKKLSESPEKAGDGEINKIYSSTFLAYVFIGVFVFIIFVFLPDFFELLFNIPQGYVYSPRILFFMLGLSFLFRMMIIPISQVAYALQRGDITVKIASINIALVQVMSVIAVLTGHGISTLFAIQLFSAIFIFLLYYFSNKKLLPDLKLELYFSTSYFKQIAKDGFWVFIANAAGNVVSQLDKLVIGAFMGAGGVTYYASSQMVPEKINSVSFSLSLSFFPIFSQASVAEFSVKTREIFRRGLSMISFIAGGLTMTVLIYNYQLLRFWLGTEIADHAFMAVNLLAFTYFLMTFVGFADLFLNGWGKLKFVAFVPVMIAIIDVAFMFILIPKFNVTGAALAYLISLLPTPFIVIAIEKMYLNSKISDSMRYYLKHLTKIFLIAIPIYLLSTYLLLPFADNLFLTIIFGGVSFGLYLCFYWLVGFVDKVDEARFKEYFRHEILRFRSNKLRI